ncbi:MAG TPA: type II secretion system F family protein, partial [Pseudidiomarina sp.]|nr:type II secretion system F family protein [Pseudidiomarina sp.]
MRLNRGRQLAFLEDFAVGLHDGLSPIQIVRELSENAEQQRLIPEQRVATAFSVALNQGQPLVGVMQRYFDSDLCMLMAVGERSGVLEPLLTQLRQFEQQRRQAQQAFWKPLLYPAVMVIVAIIAVKFIGQHVVTKL